MVVIATEDPVVLRKGSWLFAKEQPSGLLKKTRAVFSKVPITNIEQ